MTAKSCDRRRLTAHAVAVGLLVASCPVPRGSADDTAPAKAKPGLAGTIFAGRHPRNTVQKCGALGPGPQDFQGFGLGFHLGSGYGGKALGVGPSGGYPNYGGPGYPHPSPCLNRLGPITPFAYLGGPNGPAPCPPNVFGDVGPLAPDRPVIQFEVDPTLPPAEGEYGAFTGTLPDSESSFMPLAPSVSAGEAGNVAPPPPATAADRSFGAEGEPVPDSGGGALLGLKITSISPGGAAARSGLRVGDILLTIDGNTTQRSSDLDRILSAATAGSTLAAKVRRGGTGKVEEIAIPLP